MTCPWCRRDLVTNANALQVRIWHDEGNDSQEVRSNG